MNAITKQMGRIIDAQSFRDQLNPVSSAVAQCFRNYLCNASYVVMDDFRITLNGFSFVVSCHGLAQGVFTWTDQGEQLTEARVNVTAVRTSELSPAEAEKLGDAISRVATLMRYLRATTDSIDRLPSGERTTCMVIACNSWRTLDKALGESAT